MMKGLPLISLLFTRTWNLCWPRLTAVYDTLYWEGDIVVTSKWVRDVSATVSCFSSFLDHGHRIPVVLVGVAFETVSISALTYCWSEHSLPLESLSSTRTCVGWLAVAECRPGPLTWHV